MSSITVPGAAVRPPAAAAAPKRPRTLPWRLIAPAAGSLVACIALWQVLAALRLHLGLVTFENVPTPWETAQAAWALLQSPKLAQHLGWSLLRIGYGFGAATLAGVLLGLAIGRLGWARRWLLPPLEVLRPIPAVAWIPLAVLMFPSSEGSMVFITFVGALFPILLNTVHGVEGVDPRLLAAARSLGCSQAGLFREVVLPAAAPSIVTGLAIGMGTCWFCLVSAEMISGQFGIGYYTWESYTVQNYPNIVVGMLVIGVLGMGSSALLRALGRALMPWQRKGASR
jgi:NitT/TauT family transport system permease protein